MNETSSGGLRAKVFVSYSRRDAGFADTLAAGLVEQGFEAFVDKKDIAAGEPWKERLGSLIAAADTVAFVVSPDSVASPVCGWEITESQRLGKRILPIVCRPVADTATPSALARLNYIFATGPEQMPGALDRLRGALETDLGWVREHTRLTEIAVHWAATGKSTSATLRGRDLEDAERWLSHQPGHSSEPTEVHRELIRSSRRAARIRQRAWVGGSVVVAVLALGLAGFAEVNRQDAVLQRDAAEAAKTEAQAQQARADRSLKAATDAANTFVNDIGQRFRDAPGMPAALIKSIIEPAVALQEKLVASGETDPTLRDGQSHALNLMSATLLRIGETAAARDTADHALRIARSLVGADPSRPVRPRRLLESLSMVGDADAQSGRQSDALAAYGERLTLARIQDESHSTDATRRELITSMSRVASVLDATGKGPDALQLLEQALPVARALAASGRTDEARDDLSAILQEIGTNRTRLDNSTGALAAFNEALALRTEDRKDLPDSAAARSIALLRQDIALASMAQGDKVEALSSIGASVDAVRKLAWDKTNAENQRLLANILFMAGGMRLITATDPTQRAEARTVLEEAIAVSRALAEDRANAKAGLELAGRLVTIAQAGRQLGLTDTDAVRDLADAMSIYLRLKAEGHLTTEGSRSMALAAAMQAAATAKPIATEWPPRSAPD